MTPRDIFRSRQTKIFTALHCLWVRNGPVRWEFVAKKKDLIFRVNLEIIDHIPSSLHPIQISPQHFNSLKENILSSVLGRKIPGCVLSYPQPY